MNKNLHIEKYLENYLTLDKPEFAVLLSGKWGSGKTYFIDEFIEKNKTKDEIKFIKISLFGLKEVDSIDEQIFQNLHPFLGNKYVKLTGNIAKNALKFGIKLDWKDDSKADGTGSIDLSKFNPLDFFSDDKKSKIKIIFVFDDLERTDIDLIEVLGYINYLVEQSEFNVIILANEEKLIDEKSENKPSKYIEFKEKVIGKTFQVQHDFENILISLISKNTEKSKKYLNKNKNIIREIYSKAEHHNLRHIKQILLDFEYFIKLVDDIFLENKEFISILINNFFALSIEVKSGKLKETELLKSSISLWDFSNKDKKEKNYVEIVYEKYNIADTPLFSGKGWVSIIFTSSLGREVVNKVICDLSFFLKTKEKETWVKLWYYRELENDDFEKVLNDVLDKFRNCLYEKPEHLLHVVALLIFFSKEKLCNLNINNIKSQIDICMKKYQTTLIWKNELFEDKIRFNRTGLGYMNKEDKDFQELFKLIREENKKIYNKELKVREINKLDIFLQKITNLDSEFIINLLLQEYEYKPIFQNLSPKKFFDILTNTSNKNITELRYILNERYSENKSLDNIKCYCYMTDELSFWEEVEKELELSLNKTDKLKEYTLEQFNNYAVSDIILKLKSCDGNN